MTGANSVPHSCYSEAKARRTHGQSRATRSDDDLQTRRLRIQCSVLLSSRSRDYAIICQGTCEEPFHCDTVEACESSCRCPRMLTRMSSVRPLASWAQRAPKPSGPGLTEMVDKDQQPGQMSDDSNFQSQSVTQPQGASSTGQHRPVDLQTLIGQAAAIFAVVAAGVYAAGALSIAFKLWYAGVPILPVLVQLPRGWSITQAITGLLPIAIVAALLLIFIWERIRRFRIGKLISEPANIKSRSARRRCEIWRWVISVILAFLFTIITILIARFAWITPIPSDGHQASIGIFPRPLLDIFVISLILDAISIRLALYVLPKIPRSWQSISRGVTRAVILTLAFIPIVASATTPYAFPLVKLCGSQFTHPAKVGANYTLGNLIGVSGQYIYITQLLTKEPRPHKFQFAAGYIAVLPLSEIKMLAIGRDASCGPFAPPVSPK